MAAVVALLVAGEARAAPPTVTSVHPAVPLRAGVASAELGFEVEGQASTLAVKATGTSSAGSFVALARTVVERDYASAVPFHLSIPFAAPLPTDGVLKIEAQAIGPDGVSGPAVVQTLVLSDGAPAFARSAPVKVRRDPSGAVVVEVAFSGQVAQAEASVIGVSSQALRDVHGNLAKVNAAAMFAYEAGAVAYPRLDAPGKVSFRIAPTREVPIDGVVVADLTLRDPFGRAVHTSTVDFTDAQGFDTILGVEVAPSPLLLTELFTQREQLKVVVHFAAAGDVDLSGEGKGVTYASSAEDVAAVTRDGKVIARSNGTARISASYGGSTGYADVVVDTDAQLDGIALGPPGATIPRVGASLPLKVEGLLSTGQRVDLTPSVLGTTYASSDPGVVTVSPEGKVTSKRPGTATITASHEGYHSTLVVNALDGPPTIALRAPITVPAGATFDVVADAADDIGVARVAFSLNGVVSSEVKEAPYRLRLRAPPNPGATMKVSAVVWDSGGQQATSVEATIRVASAAVAGRAPSWENPQAGAMLIQGLPVMLQVTSGDGFSGDPDDYQAVRFTVDDVPVGTCGRPRLEMRTKPQSDESKAKGEKPESVMVPIWEVSYIPKVNAAGTGLSLRAEATTPSGAVVVADTLLVRVVADAPPLITVQKPAGDTADATAGVPFVVSGHIGDDAMGFGVDAALLVEGSAVARARLTAKGLEGTAVGDAGFEFSWTPPASLIGKMVKVEVQAIDVARNERRKAIDVTVRVDQPPQVAILTPQANASLPMGAKVLLTARADDDGATKPTVTWLVNGQPVGAATAPPYALEYLVPVTAADQLLEIEAVGRDSAGQESRAKVSVHAVLDKNPPSLSIVTPRNLADVPTSQSLLVSVAGLDDVGVAKVEILFDGQVLATDSSPSESQGVKGSFVSHAIVPPAQLSTSVDHHLTARAWDASGNVGRAPEVLIHTHADAPPTVKFLTPAPATEITVGTKAEVLVEATDDVAVGKVELFVGGSATPFASAMVPPYRFTVPISGPPRALTLRAVATDSPGPGLTPQEAEATLNVQVVADTKPPLVAFRSPTEGEKVFAGRTAKVTVVASDNVGVSEVNLTASAGTVTLSSHTSDELYQIYTYSLAVPAGAAGSTVTLTAQATDTAALHTSRTMSLRAVTDLAPKVSILTPPPGAPYKEGEDVRVAFTVADDDGVIGLAGLSGGNVQGTLPGGGARIDTSGEQVLTVWAPIVSKGEPATVGIVARDTALQDGSATVPVKIAEDTEAPSAVLAAPLPGKPAGTPVEVRENGSLGMRVEVGDDVRVKRVAVMLRPASGALRELTDEGKDYLKAANEKFVEERTDNPIGPGEILISRRYQGTFQGTISLKGVAPGRYSLYARAFDPHGNATSTSEVEIEVVGFVDRTPPKVAIQVLGAPNDGQLVSGSQVKLQISATDDGNVASIELTGPNGPIAVEPFDPGPSKSVLLDYTVPPLAAMEEDRWDTLTAKATDMAGRAGEASITRQVVPNAAPTVSVAVPTVGAVLTEERAETTSLTVTDDVGVQAVSLVLSSTAVLQADAQSVRVAAPAATASAPGGTVRFSFWDQAWMEVSAVDGAIVARSSPDVVTPWSAGTGVTRLRVRAPGVTGPVTIQYRYRLTGGMTSAVDAWMRGAPGGRQLVTLTGPEWEANLDYPSGVQLEQVQVELPVGSGIRDAGLAVLDTRGSIAPQLRAHAFDQAIAYQPVPPPAAMPGARNVSTKVRVPAGWGLAEAKLTAVAVDGAGLAGVLTTAHPVVPDRTAPVLREPALRLAAGRSPVENAPFDVVFTFEDDVVVDHVELLVDGAQRGEATPPLAPSASQNQTFTLTLPLSGSGPVPITALAQDRAGNASITDPLYVTVVADKPPAVAFTRVYSALESVASAQLSTGIVRLLQATPATISLSASDDVGIQRLEVTYDGVPVPGAGGTYSNPSRSLGQSVTITPPVRADGTPTLLVVSVWDTAGHRTDARLIIETRHPEAPALAMVWPAQGQEIAEGSIQLVFSAVSGDDTGVAGVEFYINGQRAAALDDRDSADVELQGDLDADGLPIAADAAIRVAVEHARAAAPPTVKPPFDDVSRLREYRKVLTLPPGFVALEPGRDHTWLSLRAVATDKEGNRSVVDRQVEVVKDQSKPQIEFLKPLVNGEDVIENTPYRVRLAALDNVLVDRVEISTGPNAQELTVEHVATGFQAANARPNSPGGVYTPDIEYQLTVPHLNASGTSFPWFVSVRARDLSGNWSDPYVRWVDVVQDRAPAAAIVSPTEYGRAVEGTKLPVIVAAEDDVAISSVELWVDGMPAGLVLYSPPFNFAVTVPAATPGRMLSLRARALDTYGHQVFSQVVQVPVVADGAPTVAVAEPKDGAHVTEGRDLAFVVAAQDDAGVTSVEAWVEGGLAGTLRFTATARPYGFVVPVPPGSAGRTLTFHARARDAVGHVVEAVAVRAQVVADTTPPTVAFLSPTNASEIRGIL